MSFEVAISLVSLLLVIIGNIVLVSVFVSKMNTRITHCEENIKSLHVADKVHMEDLKALHEIKGQLSLLIQYIIPTNLG